MFLRALPYVLVWLDAVLLFVDPTPTRTLLAFAGVAAAGLSRLLCGRRTIATAALAAAAAAPVGLVLTAASTDGLSRAVVAAVSGTFALYCMARGVRG